MRAAWGKCWTGCFNTHSPRPRRSGLLPGSAITRYPLPILLLSWPGRFSANYILKRLYSWVQGKWSSYVDATCANKALPGCLIVNRSLQKAEELAAELDATALTLDNLDDALPEADILISSNSQPKSGNLAKKDVKSALRKRRHRPMFLVDIAVPREISILQVSSLKGRLPLHYR